LEKGESPRRVGGGGLSGRGFSRGEMVSETWKTKLGANTTGGNSGNQGKGPKFHSGEKGKHPEIPNAVPREIEGRGRRKKKGGADVRKDTFPGKGKKKKPKVPSQWRKAGILCRLGD